MNYDELLERLVNLRKRGEASFLELIEDLKAFDKSRIVDLLSLIIDREGFVLQCESLEILANIDIPEYQGRAEFMLNHEDGCVRGAVCSLLGEYPGPRSEDLLLSHLPIESDADARSAAVESLQIIGTSRSLALLARLAEEDHVRDYGGWSISQLAQSAIETIRSRGGR